MTPPPDIARIRADFPVLSRTVHDRPGKPGRPLVYLDNAASAQKPGQVIDAMARFMAHDYANVHRGVHYLSQTATDAFETVRTKVARFINAPSPDTIVFTHSATEAFNLVAQSYGRTFFQAGDEVVLSVMEHHANIVPWQLLQKQVGIVLKVVPTDSAGHLDMDAYAKALGPCTKLVSITHGSNVLGTITPAQQIARLAHDKNIPVLFDGCQAAVHGPVDVQAIDADFYIFTAHKLYGPTGLGVLYGKNPLLKKMPPYQGGGDMILSVSFDGTTFKDPPMRFEAGTPPIVEVIGLGAAIDWVSAIGWPAIQAHEYDLLQYATEKLLAIPGVAIQGRAEGKASIISFTVEGIHPHDLGTLIDRAGVAVRVGQHCAEPLMRHLGVEATTRASFAVYNTRTEADVLADAVLEARKMWKS
ncbi:MAG: cysteine desulfurase [Pseudomonadota bacterium]|nr:cysteine desulfurase [Pseudomonadota bacterium]